MFLSRGEGAERETWREGNPPSPPSPTKGTTLRPKGGEREDAQSQEGLGNRAHVGKGRRGRQEGGLLMARASHAKWQGKFSPEDWGQVQV